MKVYILDADSDRYKSLVMITGDLFEFAGRFDGKPMKRPWTDVKIGLAPDANSFPKGDFPSLIPSVPMFSRRAITALGDLLEGNGEALPITCDSEEYFLFNVTRVVDSLDEPNSEIVRFEGSSRVLNIHNYAFFREKLFGFSIFKIPQLLRNIFVTDIFVKRVKSAGLKGFWFPRVWSSE
jgi:hypothetical protein